MTDSHLWEDQYLMEIIDPETGEVLPEGEEGELVLTSLQREAMPLIRYRTHDLTRILSGALSLRQNPSENRPHEGAVPTTCSSSTESTSSRSRLKRR